jgi:N-acetylglucosaminylphosphatidylinositol deacetylase
LAIWHAGCHYIGAPRTGLGARSGTGKTVMVLTPRGYWIGFRAMLRHRSQLVWFRWLYLAFSRLMWVNELVDMGT